MKPGILLAQRAPIEDYPPVLNQAALLEQIGDVRILDFADAERSSYLTSRAVHRVRVQDKDQTSRTSRIRSALRYRREFLKELSLSPGVVIAYEPDAASLLLRREAPSSTLRIVHLHEHPTEDAYAASVIGRLSLKRTLSRLHSADVVVVADEHRASELMSLAVLKAAPTVVMNCPLRVAALPRSALLPAVRARGHAGPIVHYHGAVGPDHGLETAVRSMKSWSADSCFAIVGSGPPAYMDSLRTIASAEGVLERIAFLGRVPYSEVFANIAGASVGLSLLDTSKPNWRFAAGASNKRFEYMAMGVPQITSPGPGISGLFGDTGVALLADPNDPAALAAQVNTLLSNEALRSTASASARKLHCDRFNYEVQFEPVMNAIRGRLL